MWKNMIKEPKILAAMIIAFIVFVLFTLLLILPTNIPIGLTYVFAVIGQLSAAIFFPILISFLYNQVKEKEEGEVVWRVFKEFFEGGIIRVYKDREDNDQPENGHKDLKKDFLNHKEGTIKLIGVSLRVFFHQSGPHYSSIEEICNKHLRYKKVDIHALICDLSSPELANRANVENPNCNLEESIGYNEVKGTISSIEKLKGMYGTNSILFQQFISAPYCTAIIFPDKCYISQNILSPNPPVKLPLIKFSKDSHGYKMISEYFDYVWNDTKKNGSTKMKPMKIFSNDVTRAYTHMFSKVKHINKLRIYAPSTAIIQPHFLANNDIEIDDCVIMIRKVPINDKLYSDVHSREIDSLIDRWKMMVDDGRIKKLAIIGYDKISDLYYIVCDDNILMTDLFALNTKSTSGQQTNNGPIIYYNDTLEGREYIMRCIKQFDNYEKHYKESATIYKNY